MPFPIKTEKGFRRVRILAYNFLFEGEKVIDAESHLTRQIPTSQVSF